jgi:hypothetical protein
MYIGIIAWVVQQTDESSDNGFTEPTWILVVVAVWNLLMLIATVIAIVDSILKIRARKARQLATDAMVVKLAGIPFFLLNFAVLMFLFNFGGISFAMGIGMVVWVVVAIGGSLSYLTMLSTSVYVWAAIAQLRRERIIGTGLTVLYMLLSFIFVTDIAAGVLLFGHSGRRPRLALVRLLLGTGIAMIVVGVTDYFFGFLDGAFPELGFYGIDWLDWVIPVVAGIVVILVTGIVAVVRRSALRLEAQRAATAVDGSTERTTSDLVPAG